MARGKWFGPLIGLAAILAVATGCGEQAGTESGNPINPVPPPFMGGMEPTVPVIVDPPMPPTPPVQLEPDLGTAGPTPMTGGPTSPPTSPGVPAAGVGDNSGRGPVAGAGAQEAVQCEPATCAAQANAAAERLSRPQVAPAAFESAECVTLGDEHGCQCGALVRVSAADCAASDRFGNCLYAGDEFSGCRPADLSDGGVTAGAKACSETCDAVHQRLEDEAMGGHVVQVRVSDCVKNRCRYVLSVEDRCYVAEPLQSANCADSDATLLGQ